MSALFRTLMSIMQIRFNLFGYSLSFLNIFFFSAFVALLLILVFRILK